MKTNSRTTYQVQRDSYSGTIMIDRPQHSLSAALRLANSTPMMSYEKTRIVVTTVVEGPWAEIGERVKRPIR